MCGKIFKVFIVIACAVAFCVGRVGIGMADKKTVGQLRECVDELMDLFQYFVFDEVESIDSDEQHDSSIIAVEFGRPDYNEFISYDYDAIYKKIDDVVDKIKCIDTKERI